MASSPFAGVRDDEVSNSSSEIQSDEEYAWIPWFCSLKGNEFFCEVEDGFAQDGFNLTGLNSQIPYYDHALDIILDIEPGDVLSDDHQELVDNDAEKLYGLIHARYVLTSRGLQAMLDKFRQGHFGRCPRVMCRGQNTLPVGISDTPSTESVKTYCPRCEDVYACRSTRHENIDGAYFGTTFPHLFFLTYPELKVSKSEDVYVPRVFGFKVHADAYKISLEYRRKSLMQQKTEREEQRAHQKSEREARQREQREKTAAGGTGQEEGKRKSPP
eukprot:gb/GEZN01006598.1/.p1 GENE.gb/GEZN01006598.1/~~gb/GEZN01006598.1/.p1  ORF type:complete len:272 (+),score=40.04 gb/GEZN01006598.1/:61-876(+)